MGRPRERLLPPFVPFSTAFPEALEGVRQEGAKILLVDRFLFRFVFLGVVLIIPFVVRLANLCRIIDFHRFPIGTFFCEPVFVRELLFFLMIGLVRFVPFWGKPPARRHGRL